MHHKIFLIIHVVMLSYSSSHIHVYTSRTNIKRC